MSTSEAVVGETIYDAIIIGGGPAGTIAGMALKKNGRSAIILEKATFPRFHIGESFLPATFSLLKKLGLEEAFRKLPHVPKFGADFAMGYGGKYLRIDFEDGFCPEYECFNIERSVFDEMLLEEAKKAGVEYRQTTVKKIHKLSDGDCRIETEHGEIRGRYVLDASGQQTVIGKHLGTKKLVTDPDLKKVAYFSQFDNVKRPTGREVGHPLIAMVDEGWFWMIPLNEHKTSVGIVLSAHVAKGIMEEHNLKSDEILQWAIDRTPIVKDRMTDAKGVFSNQIIADFSYNCRPFAGEGHFLIGDAAAFMDPIFSTGVSVAVNTALAAANFVDAILAERISPAKARKRYIADLEESTGTLFKIIRQYYDHSFRELFLEGQGPMQVEKAVIGVLAGNVFPRPPFKMRWRLKLFDYFVKLNRKKQIVPRRRKFSLLKNTQRDMQLERTEQSIPLAHAS